MATIDLKKFPYTSVKLAVDKSAAPGMSRVRNQRLTTAGLFSIPTLPSSLCLRCCYCFCSWTLATYAYPIRYDTTFVQESPLSVASAQGHMYRHQQ